MTPELVHAQDDGVPNDLHPTRTVAARLGVSVWTVTRTAKEHELYTLKVPGATGAYLFDDDAVARLADHLNRPVRVAS